MTVDLMEDGMSINAVWPRGLQSKRVSLGSFPNETFQRDVEFAVESANHFKG